MNTLPHWFASSQLAAAWLDYALKSFLVLAMAGLVCRLWRQGTASARHLIWLLALAGLLIIPVLTIVLPGWSHPLWTVASRATSANEISLRVEMVPGKPTPPTPPTGIHDTARDKAVTALPQGPLGNGLSARFSTNWAAMILGTWLTGALWFTLSVLAGHYQIAQMRRQARPPTDSRWAELLESLCQEMGMGRPVTLLQSGEQLMPVTWGTRHPVILLPAGADEWAADRQRVVLLHELAHIRRWDCLTQLLAHLACAIYWFNPLVWLAARQMLLERESACDDLVLNGGCRPSEYASHLLAIARGFRPVRSAAAIAMARPSQLQNRIEAIVDSSRTRRPTSALLGALYCVLGAAFVLSVAAQKSAPPGKPWYDDRLRAFFSAKEAQARELAKTSDLTPTEDVWRYFAAGNQGNWTKATNLWQALRARAHQYEGTKADARIDAVWSPILETELAWEQFANWQEKDVLAYGNDIIRSIPPGSIYFGGTDPGRGVITAMSEAHASGKPFFTITQNALADNTYLDYVRKMYGAQLDLPAKADSEKAFADYVADAGKRLEHDTQFPKEPRQIRPGEDVTKKGDSVQVSGQVAVMAINSLIARTIFDRNATKDFYLEESFPLDWMYPHLTPNGLIMKVNREPLSALPADVVRQDHDYWSEQCGRLLGDWLKPETSVAAVTAFAEKVHGQHDLAGFSGDRDFVADQPAQKAYSKLRSAIGGVYYWRISHAKNPEERKEMVAQADFAFRQAYALCPNSPEALYRFVQLLASPEVNRVADALLLAETTQKLDSGNAPVGGLVQQLKQMKARP